MRYERIGSSQKCSTSCQFVSISGFGFDKSSTRLLIILPIMIMFRIVVFIISKAMLFVSETTLLIMLREELSLAAFGRRFLIFIPVGFVSASSSSNIVILSLTKVRL